MLTCRGRNVMPRSHGGRRVDRGKSRRTLVVCRDDGIVGTLAGGSGRGGCARFAEIRSRRCSTSHSGTRGSFTRIHAQLERRLELRHYGSRSIPASSRPMSSVVQHLVVFPSASHCDPRRASTRSVAWNERVNGRLAAAFPNFRCPPRRVTSSTPVVDRA